MNLDFAFDRILVTTLNNNCRFWIANLTFSRSNPDLTTKLKSTTIVFSISYRKIARKEMQCNEVKRWYFKTLRRKEVPDGRKSWMIRWFHV
jgi:hypothetical protein